MPEPIRISATDGYALGATLFNPSGRGSVVVVNAATGVKQRYYAKFAQWLTETHDCTVITYDYRGIGESRPHRLRGFEARMRDWGQLDFDGVLHFADTFDAKRPRAAIGHSIGGQILGFAPNNTILSRAVTVASQSGYWRHWPGSKKAVMWAIWFGLMPAASHAVGYLPGRLGAGEDLPKEVALEWARWGRKPDFFTADGISSAGFERLRIPIQVWSLADDTSYAPRAAVDWLQAQFTNATVDRRHVSPNDLGARRIGHFGAFREEFRQTLWPQFAAGLTEASAPALNASAQAFAQHPEMTG